MTTTLTADDIARLSVSLEARVTQFTRALDKAQQDSQKATAAIAKQHDRAASAVERTWSKPIRLKGLGAARKEVDAFRTTLLGAFGAGFIGGAVSGLITGLPRAFRETTRSIVELRGEATKAGVSFQAFQQLKYAADVSGVSLAGLTDGLKELQLRADEFVFTGKGPAAEAFGRLGYGAEELQRKLADPVTLFDEIIKRLKVLDTAAQIRITDELFGATGGEEFLKFLRDGTRDLKAMTDEATRVGAVLDDDIARRAAEVDAQFHRISVTIGTRIKEALVAVGGELADLLEQLDTLDRRSTTSILSEIERREQAIADIRRKGLGAGYLDENHEAEIAKLRQELARRAVQAGPTPVPDSTTWLRTGPQTVGPTATFDSSKVRPGMSTLDISRTMEGWTENRDGAAISAFLGSAGITNLSPKDRAWCAEYANAVLIRAGHRGTGSAIASSFSSWGEATDRPREGDVVVLKPQAAGTSGHVGFFAGYNPDGSIRVHGGNQGYGDKDDGVGEVTFGADQVSSFRRVPTGQDYEDSLRQADEQAAAIKRISEALDDERKALGLSAIEQRVLNEVKAAGVTLDSQAGQMIAEKVRALGAEQAALDARTAAQERANEAASEFAGLARDTVGGFLHDLKDGVGAAEALGRALDRLSDRLLDMALDSLFKPAAPGQAGGLFANPFAGFTGGAPATAGAASGGLLGGFLIPGILHSGGVAGRTAVPGRVVPPSIFANAPRLHSGIRPGEYAAILEEGERVATELQTKREAAAMGALTSFAKGGARNGGGRPLTFAPVTNVDARGSELKREDFEAIIARNNRALRAEIPAIVQRHQMDRT